MTPAPYYSGGPLSDVAADFRAHLDAEGRRSWTTDAASLVVSPAGVSVAGFPPVDFEPRGKRSLLIHYGDVFPRSAPTLTRLSPATFALVWKELTEDGTPTVQPMRVWTRGAPARVFLVTPASYNRDLSDAGTILEGLAEVFPSALATVEYDPDTLVTRVVVGFDVVRVEVDLRDDPEDGGMVFRAFLPDGDETHDPLPHVRPRRRTGAASTVEALVDKCRALIAAHAAQTWVCVIEGEDATGKRFTLRAEAESAEAARMIGVAYRRQHRGCVTRVERA